jgi:lysophospholipase L1-like esterase
MKLRPFILLGFAFILSACGQGSSMIAPTPENPLTYLALGDSYTIGESVAETDRWPVQLAVALRKQGIQIADPVIIARTGWTTDDLLRGIETKGELGTYDLVSLLIGVNDQFQGLSIDGYRQRFRELLQISVEEADGKPEQVIVLSIPDWSYTPYAETIQRPEVSAEIDAFNAVAQEESEAAGVHYFDITPMTRPSIYNAGLFADDGLHPSAKMYTLWVEMILPKVNDLFRDDPTENVTSSG